VPVIAVRKTGDVVTHYDLSGEAYVHAHSTRTTPVANLDVGRVQIGDYDGKHTWVILGTHKKVLLFSLAHSLH
jgi:hypothetical protein